VTRRSYPALPGVVDDIEFLSAVWSSSSRASTLPNTVQRASPPSTAVWLRSRPPGKTVVSRLPKWWVNRPPQPGGEIGEGSPRPSATAPRRPPWYRRLPCALGVRRHGGRQPRRRPGRHRPLRTPLPTSGRSCIAGRPADPSVDKRRASVGPAQDDRSRSAGMPASAPAARYRPGRLARALRRVAADPLRSPAHELCLRGRPECSRVPRCWSSRGRWSRPPRSLACPRPAEGQQPSARTVSGVGDVLRLPSCTGSARDRSIVQREGPSSPVSGCVVSPAGPAPAP